jgi:TRAP transporter 4TM/12TM fusion protein
MIDIKKGSVFYKAMAGAILVFGMLLSCFHLYATMTGTVTVMRQRVVHVTLVLTIALLINLQKKIDGEKRIGIFELVADVVILAVSLISLVYLYVNDAQIVFHLGNPTKFEVFLGVALTLAVLEMTRRAIGPVMPMIAVVALLYALFGNHLPGSLACKGYSLKRIASYLLLSDDGLFGTPIGVSASTVILFIIFGAFLEATGAGETFIELAFSFFGRVRGGPAKVAVVGSALFGMINGSAIANVVSTGSLTIPLMKNVGYQPEEAGAVEAVSSTGGQIMPPIMGAAAFIMAQTLAIPYMSVAKAAIIPAVLYFFMVFISVDLLAVKNGLKGLPASELPSAKKVLKEGWFLLLPIIILLYMLIGLALTANKAALYAVGICIVVSWFSKDKKMKLREIINALVAASKEICSVALACATAGIVIGMLGLTGFGLKMSSLLLEWSGGHLIVLMIYTAIAGIILGMGLPTSGVYIVLAVLAAPALIQMDVPAIAAHMFVFYFGVIAAITPPVALASYAGAGIAKADASKTGWNAVKIGMAGFILPFMFVLNPAILMIGEPLQIIQVVITSVVAIVSLSMGLNGTPFKNVVARVLLGAAALLLLDSSTLTDVIGLVMVVSGLAIGKISSKKVATTA